MMDQSVPHRLADLPQPHGQQADTVLTGVVRQPDPEQIRPRGQQIAQEDRMRILAARGDPTRPSDKAGNAMTAFEQISLVTAEWAARMMPCAGVSMFNSLICLPSFTAQSIPRCHLPMHAV